MAIKKASQKIDWLLNTFMSADYITVTFNAFNPFGLSSTS